MSQYIYIAIAVVIALLGLEITLLKGDIKVLNQEIAKLHENEGTYKSQINELAGTIAVKDKDLDLCNKRTEELRKQADDRAAQAEKAREEARKAAKENKALADELLSFKRKPGQDACGAADELFNEYLEKRQNRVQKTNPN